jgi:hypothetical protein
VTCASGMAGSNNAPLEEVLIAAAYQDNERYRTSGVRGVYGEEGRDSEGTNCDNGHTGSVKRPQLCRAVKLFASARLGLHCLMSWWLLDCCSLLQSGRGPDPLQAALRWWITMLRWCGAGGGGVGGGQYQQHSGWGQHAGFGPSSLGHHGSRLREVSYGRCILLPAADCHQPPVPASKLMASLAPCWHPLSSICRKQ